MNKCAEKETINVFFEDRSYKIRRKEVIDTIEKVLRKEKRYGEAVNIIFLGDKRITELNRMYFGKNSTTDVISFNFDDNDLLGEIYISLPQARRQAKEYSVFIKQEVKRLLIHGLLHLLGYDHTDKDNRSKMIALQENYLKQV